MPFLSPRSRGEENWLVLFIVVAVYLYVHCCCMFAGIFFNIFLFFCLFVFRSCQEERRSASHLYFFVLSIQICSAICFTFCLPLGEGHGSQDSEVRGKTDEDKWKVETTVDNKNVDDFVNPNRPKKGLNTVKRIPSPPCICKNISEK